jgi:hypothetical protein
VRTRGFKSGEGFATSDTLGLGTLGVLDLEGELAA